MSYFSDKGIDEKDRRDIAFQAVNAIRETITLAKDNTLPVTYEFAMGVIHDLNPEIHKSVTQLLATRNENDTIRFYKEKAEIISTDEKRVLPYELVTNDLIEIEDLLKNANEKSTTLLRKRKIELKDALDYFQPTNLSEHKCLSHDFSLKAWSEMWGKPIYETDDDLERFYSEKNIPSFVNKIRVHAQSVDIESDFNKNKNRF